eukprot:845131_1
MYGNLDIIASWLQSLRVDLLNASHMVNGTFFVKSYNGASDGHPSQIYCPGNGINCTVECGRDGCSHWRFHTQPDTHLHVTAYENDAMEGAHVHCPTGNGTCSIHAHTGSGDIMLDHLIIYSVNGLDDTSLILTCDGSCYHSFAPPRIACSSDYGVVIQTGLVSGYDNWQYIAQNRTDLCDDSTTNGYYGNTFYCEFDYDHECVHDMIMCNSNQTHLVAKRPKSA